MDIPGEIKEFKKREIEAVAAKIAVNEGKLDGGAASSTETPEVLEVKLARRYFSQCDLHFSHHV